MGDPFDGNTKVSVEFFDNFKSARWVDNSQPEIGRKSRKTYGLIEVMQHRAVSQASAVTWVCHPEKWRFNVKLSCVFDLKPLI